MYTSVWHLFPCEVFKLSKIVKKFTSASDPYAFYTDSEPAENVNTDPDKYLDPDPYSGSRRPLNTNPRNSEGRPTQKMRWGLKLNKYGTVGIRYPFVMQGCFYKVFIYLSRSLGSTVPLTR